MMSCIELKSLEKSALDQVRGKAISEQIRIHLESCQFCQEQFQKLVEQYSLADEHFKSIPEKLIKGLTDSIQPKSNDQFTLTARMHTKGTLNQDVTAPIMTRAADSKPASKKQSYENKGVLSTQNGELLIRLMESRDTNITVLHLIAEDAEKYQNVPVRIEPLGLEFITDSQGRISLENVGLPTLEQMNIVVQTPRAVFDLKEMPQDWKEFIGKGEIQLRNADDEQLIIEFNPEGRKYRLTVRLEKSQLADGSQKIQIIANREGRNSRFETVNKGIAVFHDVAEPASLCVKVFG